MRGRACVCLWLTERSKKREKLEFKSEVTEKKRKRDGQEGRGCGERRESNPDEINEVNKMGSMTKNRL